MKKLLIAIALLTIAGMLFGCRATTEASVSTTAAATASETTSSQTTSSQTTPTEEMIAIDYEIIRDDRSICGEDGEVLISIYYDHVVLAAPAAVSEAINAVITADRNAFFEANDLSEFTELAQQQAQYGSFVCTMDCRVANADAGYLSILKTWNWWMGGVSNCNLEGLTFDLHTGKPVTLADICPEQEQMLRSAVLEYVQREYGDGILEDPAEVLSKYTLAQIPFYIDNGQIILTFPVYTFAAGAAGATIVETNVFVGG